MVDEVITIPELQEAITAGATDQVVTRQAGIDKRSQLSTLKSYFASAASLSVAGVVQLDNTTNSSSTTTAATPNAVRVTYELASSANTKATNALDGLTDKANTAHTHVASDITAGVFNPARLPVSSSSAFGAARHTTSLANPVGDSANGYVPSLVLVNTINTNANLANSRLDTLAVDGSYLKWDGGATGLDPVLGRQSLGAAPLESPSITGTARFVGGIIQIGANSGTRVNIRNDGMISLNGGTYTPIVTSPIAPTTVGRSFLTTTNPSAVTFPRVNSDNTVSYLTDSVYRAAIGVNQSSESVSGLAQAASQAETDSGSEVLKYITPSKLRFGFSISLNQADGHIRFPSWLGGYTRVWGYRDMGGNQNSVFSGLFANACLNVVVSLAPDAPEGQRPPRAAPVGNGVRIYNRDSNSCRIYFSAEGY